MKGFSGKKVWNRIRSSCKMDILSHKERSGWDEWYVCKNGNKGNSKPFHPIPSLC